MPLKKVQLGRLVSDHASSFPVASFLNFPLCAACPLLAAEFINVTRRINVFKKDNFGDPWSRW